MNTTGRSTLAWLLSALPAVTLALGLVGAAPPASAQRTPSPEAEVCKNCHAERVESYLSTKHGQKGNLQGPDCRTCHANADEHVKAGGGRGAGGIFGFNDKAHSAQQKSAVCLSCHQGTNRVNWQSSTHANRDVACNSCQPCGTAKMGRSIGA